MPATTYTKAQLHMFVNEMFDSMQAWTYGTYVDFTHDNGYAPMTVNEYAYWVRFYANLVGSGEWIVRSYVYNRTHVPSWEKDKYVRMYHWQYIGPKV